MAVVNMEAATVWRRSTAVREDVFLKPLNCQWLSLLHLGFMVTGKLDDPILCVFIHPEKRYSLTLNLHYTTTHTHTHTRVVGGGEPWAPCREH